MSVLLCLNFWFFIFFREKERVCGCGCECQNIITKWSPERLRNVFHYSLPYRTYLTCSQPYTTFTQKQKEARHPRPRSLHSTLLSVLWSHKKLSTILPSCPRLSFAVKAEGTERKKREREREDTNINISALVPTYLSIYLSIYLSTYL